MEQAGIKISAIPAVSLVMSVGIAVEFTAHLALAYLEAVHRRPAAALANVLPPFSQHDHTQFDLAFPYVFFAAHMHACAWLVNPAE